MSLISEIIGKMLETPEIINQMKKSLVNLDMSIEIDGKRFQIMKKRDDNEVDNLEGEVIMLKSKLYDIEIAAKALLDVKDNDCKEFERLNHLVWNQ